jgi:hypothetical protein
MVQRKAGLYYDAYGTEKIVAFAQRNRIGIVLKYNRDTWLDDRRSVMKHWPDP